MAIFGYGRVSTRDQQSENQRLELERAGYQVDYWFADEGVSGKVPALQRPQFAKMLSQIRDRETLVVAKLDRLGRDAQDVGATIKMLAARHIEVIVLQLGKLDLASAPGKLMLTMLAAVAEMERDLLVERTQAGLARAKAEGKTLGRPTRTTDEQRATMVTRHKAGASISALSRDYAISRASVMRIVKPTVAQ
ncbi:MULTISPECIES: recombinase family protein [unclassified Massilia]|uniref:recombinase family protein n=1 Tax=unclassified Massilia TaxID=2609279 RepID=UPI00177C93CE|nr:MULTISPECIES: recombinase family protein [unclassified Massilia]MBD8531694.1 recombinase family protein [Massilia sp. CFBP 13647]MBD8675139.1 recombinase family protein [Massilia sp. CFBP 13721]